MLPALIVRYRSSTPPRRGERGVTMALVAVSMTAIIAMAALSIDVGTLYEGKAEAQRSADLAALAAARTLSISGITTDPNNTSSTWNPVCGGAGSTASLAAISVAQQNLVGGAAPSTVTVYYGTSGGVGTDQDCTSAGAGFGINPVVSVYVQQARLPTFFSRIFSLITNGTASNSGVSASAAAEAFNPSDAGSYGVQPRCVKPWLVPNLDPQHWTGGGPNCGGAGGGGCQVLVNTGAASGSIQSPGLFTVPGNSGGVIGEIFWLIPDCTPGATCSKRSGLLPMANYSTIIDPNPLQNLEYLPGAAPASSVAVPAAASGSCSLATSQYAQAITGCDQSTQYQCGVSWSSAATPNVVDLTQNPITDTSNGGQCLINQGTPTSTALAQLGQDDLSPFAEQPAYPFQIQAGTANPLLNNGLTSGSVITASTSIVSLPIFNQVGATIGNNSITPVTIVGFLQVFINFVDGAGNMNVTVMNITGCGTSPGTVIGGTSPVPIRLITPP
jgi:Flp pilus assembly protein TadG